MKRFKRHQVLAVAGIALVTASPVGHTEVPNSVIGRLFLSEADRARIQNSRGKESAADLALNDTAAAESKSADPDSLVLNGLVRRDNGDEIIWVNGAMLGEGLGTSDTITKRGSADAEHRVTLSAGGIARPVKLKPGQAWDAQARQAVDCSDCTNDAGEAPNEDTDFDGDQ